ncbi:MAG TPA: hypothetical protein DCQ37_09645 [Desulfobacteraceae bacterium]|nr:hypothetical protein [Desulfobacteraceae bacterium]
MYIKKLEIRNIRSISHFEMTFPKPAGWHVLIGDNGSGKSSIIRSVALGLLGPDNGTALSFVEDFSKWLKPEISKGSIVIEILRDNNYDEPKYSKNVKKEITCTIEIDRAKKESGYISGNVLPKTLLWNDKKGWFFAAYGPFRRLIGASDIFSHIASRPKLGACITAFRNDAALTQLNSWLKDLALDAPKKQQAQESLNFIVDFINSAKLLPGDAELLNYIDSDGIKIKDANGVEVYLSETSDGYHSILSMTLDIIRFLMNTYGADKVFENKSVIDLPGVVLIDEVDSHLHPTWQTRIGQWFTKFFPNIQFIVTTHSALICRACENSSIWRLAVPGSDDKSEEVTGIDKNRLIFGNVLDAYGTDVFGKSVTISENANDKLNRLAELNIKSIMGEITKNEGKELAELKAIFSTEELT